MPSDLTNLLQHARRDASEEAAIHSRLMRQARRDVGIVIPLLLSIVSLGVGVAASDLALKYFPNDAELVLLTLIVLYLALGGVHIWRHYRLERNAVSAMQFYLDLEEVDKAHKADLSAVNEVQQWSFNWLTLATEIGAIVKLHCQRIATEGGASTTEVRETCKKIVDRLAEARDICLRYRPGDETYNLHLFVWDDEHEVLETYIRVNGRRIEHNNRKWREREGHAGHCFAINQPLILGDLQGPEGQGYRINALESDKQLYRSIIDLPIPGSGERPWGVITITSGVPSQFRNVEFLPLTLVCDALAVVLSTQLKTAPAPSAAGLHDA